MKSVVLKYLNKLESYKMASLQFHWHSNSISQHELCDKIMDEVAEFEDTIAEIEQSMSGKFPLNKLKPEEYTCDTLKGFAMDIVDSAKEFLSKVEKLGPDYVGMKSEVESFIGEMQKYVYLVNFTLQEEVKRELMGEAMYKNVPDGPDGKFDKFKGQTAKTPKTRKKQMLERIHRYGIDRRSYDDPMDVLRHINKVVKDFGAQLKCSGKEGKTNEYKISVLYDDGMKLGGYVMMHPQDKGGVQAEVFLSERPDKILEFTEQELKSVIKESLRSLLINEVSFRGESFHGDNPEDWGTMSSLRYMMADRDADLRGKHTGMYNGEPIADYDKLSRDERRHLDAAIDDYSNMHQQMKANGLGWRERNKVSKEANKKAQRIANNEVDRVLKSKFNKV